MLVGRALRRGNSYALRISTRDFERSGLHEGQELALDLQAAARLVEVGWHTFRSGHHDTSERHDDVLYGWRSDA